jgi:hypothetical protein
MEDVVFTLSHWAGVLLAAYGLCACQPATQAGKQEKKQDKKIKVTLVVILADDGKEEVHPHLILIAKEIRKKDPKLTRFKLKSMECRPLAVEEKASFELVDQKIARVIVKRAADENNRVELAIKAPGQVGFVYQSVCGKFLPIITPYQTKSGERLILAVRVQPCHK